jgi:hypothetical protein
MFSKIWADIIMVKELTTNRSLSLSFHGDLNRGRQMVNTELARTMDELNELYAWLLCRAQEEEDRGRESSGQVYREFAETVKKSLPIECTRKPKGA